MQLDVDKTPKKLYTQLERCNAPADSDTLVLLPQVKGQGTFNVVLGTHDAASYDLR